MLKRLCLAFAGLFVLATVAQGAGTVPGFSLVPQFDLTGKIAPGCKLYVVQAGTVSTPQNAYQDSSLTLLQPNPMLCDAAGRLPQWFVADGSIKLRLTDKNGVQIFAQDGLLVVGASSGGGGGSPVDPTTILATGDMKVAYGTGILSGFVRANGRTIGSATSGATERANADCSALFQYLWGADANLAVSGGRGASAAADWAANKTLTLPDWRGKTIAGIDDMGAGDSGTLTGATPVTGNAFTLGAKYGASARAIAQNNLPNVAPSFAGSSGSVSVLSTNTNNVFGTPSGPQTAASGGGVGALTGTFSTTQITSTGTSTPSGTVSSINGNVAQVAMDTMQPTLLASVYLKL
jgi:hypothetical protein